MAVIVIPVALRPPFVAFHVPPLMILRPAIFARFRQFVPRMLGLFAVPAVMLDGFMKFVVGVFGAMLALRFIRFHSGRPGEEQKPAKS